MIVSHYRERNIPIPYDDEEAFRDRVSFPEAADSLADFLKRFDDVNNIVA